MTGSAQPLSVALPDPTHLLSLPLSAYHPRLFLQPDAAYLLTSSAAYRLAEGQAPERFALDLGTGPTLTESAFVFWSDGAVRRAPKAGGPVTALCEFSHAPQFFVSANERFAWIDRSEDGLSSIWTARTGRPEVLEAFDAQIAAATMLGDWVFFAEASDGNWRMSAVREQGKTVYGASHRGRPPAMLAVDAESIFYFDLERAEIVRVSPDLQREESWVSGVTCSPFAVSGAAYCASIEGLFRVSSANPTPAWLARDWRSLVTDIAADTKRVVWIRDVGPDQLSVEMLAVQSP